MSIKPVVFVIGASGSVGAATIKNLSENYAHKVEIRAGVRNPDSEKAGKLKSLSNVTVVQATMGASNLVSIFQGVSTLYIVTPTAKNRVELTTSTALSAKEAGVKRVAVVSTLTAKLPDTSFGSQYTKIERHISELGLVYTVLRLPMFMDGYAHYKQSVKHGVLTRVIDLDTPCHATTVADIGKASAAILANPELYQNKTIAILGDRNTSNEFISILSEVLQKEIKYERIPFEDELKKMKSVGVPEWIAEGLTEVAMKMESTTVYSEGDLGKFKQITGDDPTTLRKWIEDNLHVFN